MAHTLTIHPTPKKGQLTINVPHVVDVQVSAEEAEKTCRVWLMERISMSFVANPPEFMINESGRAVWRVPVMRGTTHAGIIGQIGYTDVDAQTGEIIIDDEEMAQWRGRNEKLLPKIPPFKLRTIPPHMIPPPHLRAPVIEPME